MKRANLDVMMMAVMGILLTTSGAEAQRRGPGAFAGLSFVAADPVGELEGFIDNGFGVELSGGLPMAADGHLRLRLDLGGIVYGHERIRYCDWSCRIGSDVTTTNSIVYGGIGPEIVLARGDIQPYVHAGAGFSYFVTSSNVDDGYGPILETTNFSDTVFRWSWGGGIRFRTGGRAFIDLGVERHDNQVATYLTEGDIVDQPDGDVILYPNRSEADLVNFRVGVSIGLGSH